MKRRLFTLSSCFVLLFLMPFCLSAQNNKVFVNSTQVTDLSAPPFSLPVSGVVTNTNTNRADSVLDFHKALIWVETGDGNFSTIPTISINNGRGQTRTLFAMAALLYDTTKGRDFATSRFMQLNKLLAPRSGVVQPSLLTEGQQIRLTPNVYSMVPGDTMSIAFTYRLPQNALSKEPQYYIVFLNKYNGRIAPISQPAFTSPRFSGGTAIPSFRPYKGESVVTNGTTFNIPGFSSYNQVAAYAIPLRNMQQEINFFQSLAVPTGQAINDATPADSLFAVLAEKTEDGYRAVASDAIGNVRLRLSHDPNNLLQNPDSCINLPKKEMNVNYQVNFQNIGEGNADKVKILIHLPKGYKENSLQISAVNFAGKEFLPAAFGSIFTSSYDALNKVYTFSLKPSDATLLLLGSYDAGSRFLTDSRTMGYVKFSATLKEDMPDTVSTFADIYFHSKERVNPDQWELPVTTNTTKLYFSKDCKCPDGNCGQTDCYKILGLCWWWWVLILLILLLIIWRVRKK